MFSHYVAVAFKNVRSAPFTSAVNLLTLAVGLVCFVTAYAFVTFWGTAEQHFRKARDVYVLTMSTKTRDGKTSLDDLTSVPDGAAEFMKSDYPAISKIARAVVIDPDAMVANGGKAERLFGIAVDAEFLEIFDLPFVAGNAGSALASPRSAVLTRESATRLFGSENPLGKTLVVGNEVDATVTGVVDAIPEPSLFGRSANASLPFDMITSRDVYDALNEAQRTLRGPVADILYAWIVGNAMTFLYLPPEGKLPPRALAAQLGDFAARHVPPEVRKLNDYRFDVLPVGRVLGGRGNYFGTGLSFAAVLMMLGGLVLGVACVNYANLATARAARRVREIGVRKALGAAPAQIVVQSLLEAGVFTIAALVAALALFAIAQPLVKRLLGAELGTTFFTSLGVWPALAAVVVCVTLVAGAYPAFVLSRVRPVSAIATGQGRLGSPLFATVLVGAQFAVASFLLITVTVMAAQNAYVRSEALRGLQDQLLVIENPANKTKVAAATLRERLSALPQVRGVTELGSMPWQFQMSIAVSASPDPGAAQHTVRTQYIGFDFFSVFNVPLVAGRVFDRDHGEDALQPKGVSASSDSEPLAQNVVVDRQFVATLGFASPEDGVGKLVYRATSHASSYRPPPFRIIGVVEDRSFSLFKQSNGGAGDMYNLQPDLRITVARIAAADLGTALTRIDADWKQLAPNASLVRRFYDETFERSYSSYERTGRLFATLAVMAFGICVAGLFGMAIFVAGRRRREVGVRKTLGATTAQMISLLLAGFSRPVLIANLIAWPAGYVAARTYLNRFAETIGLTLWPFLLSAAITLAIACLAVLGQTLRAARTTPAEVLRNE
jgi:putative ABC transport system permease protein